MAIPRDGAASRDRRFHRDTLEFGRIVNLSDGVFAIALTLLVLGLELPDAGVGSMAEGLRGRLPNLIAFALGFALVANIWWEHHKLVARLAYFDPRSTALNLLALGLVALAPFPTGLIGAAPTERAAVLPFIAIFVALMAVFLALIASVQRAGAWREAPNPRLFRWVIAGWWAELAGLLLALLVALVVPLAGLALAALKSPLIAAFMSRRAPPGYADWA
jgi:uncharacterized membrane protein